MNELAAPPTRSRKLQRAAALTLLLALAAGAAYLLFKTPLGQELSHRQTVKDWVWRHWISAPIILIGVYVLLSVSMLPVWELQLAAGFGFGMTAGILWCEIGATLGGIGGLLLSRWLVGEWFRTRYESRMDKLHAINEKLGHNGLLVVMGVRLCHVLPFGLSNYLFGLTRITVMEVLIGTLAGNLPTIAIYVTGGARPHLLKGWEFWAVLGAVNVLLLVPLALRYLKPQWFRKIGVE